MLAAYSALNFGHRHPRLIEAAKRQLDRVTLTSRAFHNDLFGPFCEQLAELCGKDMVLTMNTGAEAVETAIKAARRWGYDVKGVAPDRAKIVVAGGNFHGRTVTIVSFSDDPSARRRVRAIHARVRDRARTATSTRSRAGDRRRHRRVPRRADPGRGRGGRPARRVPARRRASSAPNGTSCCSPTRSSRGSGRTGTTFAMRARGRRARRLHPGEGARRRDRGALGGRRRPGRARRVPARRARLHVRWEPARVRRGPRGPRHPAIGRVPGALGRARRVAARRPPRCRVPERRRGPRPRAVDRDRSCAPRPGPRARPANG